TTNLNFETTPVYSLTLTVSDGANVSAVQSISVLLIDENDVPVFSPAAAMSIPENSPAGTIVGYISAVDPDVGDVLTYSIVSGVPNQPFAVDSANGTIRVVDSSLLDFETTTVWNVTVRVTDAGGLTDTQVVTIAAIDQNEAPTDLLLSGGSVDENSAVGTVVGSVSGLDADAGDLLTYSLLNDAGGRFTIDMNSGTISVADGSLLNFESASTHQIRIRATDQSGLTYNETFIITLNDVNEAPVAVGDQYLGLQLETIEVGPGGLLHNDSDVDGDGLTVVLVTTTAHGSLLVSGDGSFVYKPAQVFSGVDSFSYYVTDGQLISNTVTVTLTVQQTVTGTGNNNSTPPPDSSTAPTNGGDSTTPPPVVDSESTDSTENGNGPSLTVGSGRNRNHPNTPGIAAPSGAETTKQIIEATRSELFISVFLDDVPEANSDELQRAALRSQVSQESTVDHNAGNFLFETVETDRPLFAGVNIHFRNDDFLHHREEREVKQQIMEKVVVGTTAAVSTSVSVGYVVWMLRGGSLLTTFLSSLPAWQAFDPLPVLESFEEEGESEEAESLATMVAGGDQS
ncbi:MAG: cadherin domain-containing protein, partial [Planctomycetaceae bacterium]|nr:cadherin domain-containing protein [Planctomycetaceae bacterium]